MRIDPNLPPKSPQGNQRADGARLKKPTGSEDDLVEISQGAQDVGTLADVVKGRDIDSSRRVSEVRSKVESGYYDSASGRREIAEALLRSDKMRELAEEVDVAKIVRERIEQLPDVRADRVSEVKSRLREGHYESREVIEETAQRILDQMV